MRAGDSGRPGQEVPATTATAAIYEAPELAMTVPEVSGVPDDDAAIQRVLGADPARLKRVLRGDRAVRQALRWCPTDGAAEQARTLVAAARVERRRRASRAFESAAGVADVLAAAQEPQ